jgi:hypothetical protein
MSEYYQVVEMEVYVTIILIGSIIYEYHFIYDSLLHVYFLYICFMRRILYFLLAIFTIFLALTPCQDEVELVKDNTSISTMRMNTYAAHPLHVTDQCSPFCMCSCCAHSTVGYMGTLGIMPVTSFLINTKLVFTYTSKIPVSAPISIWQPPQDFV